MLLVTPVSLDQPFMLMAISLFAIGALYVIMKGPIKRNKRK